MTGLRRGGRMNDAASGWGCHGPLYQKHRTYGVNFE